MRIWLGRRISAWQGGSQTLNRLKAGGWTEIFLSCKPQFQHLQPVRSEKTGRLRRCRDAACVGGRAWCRNFSDSPAGTMNGRAGIR